MPRSKDTKAESNLWKDRLGLSPLSQMGKIIAEGYPQFDQKRFLAFLKSGKL